ncbi:MAG: hypothetical protein V1895_03305 [Parcubacteria group bacterium]
MSETSTLTPLTFVSPIRQTLAVTRIKTYTRKLAEIERFIEHYAPNATPRSDPGVIVHRYWQV